MTERELTLADYMAMLRRRWMLIVVLALVGGPLAYGVSRLLPDRYKSQTLVLVERPSVPEKIVASLDNEDLSQRLSSMQQQILSRSRLEPIINQFGLYSGEVSKVPMEDLVGQLQKAIEVTPITPMAATQSQLPGFYVNVTMGNARTAQQVCTAVTSMFIEENLRLRQQHAEDTTQFLVTQLAEAKANLDEQDAKLAAFKSHYLGALPEQEQMNLNLLSNMTSQLDAATQALARPQQDKSFAESMLTQQIATWQATQTGHSPETLEQQLAALQTQLATLQSRYTDDYPDVIKAKNDIASLKKQIAAQADAQKSSSEANKTPKNSLEPTQIAQLRAQIHNLDQEIAQRTREQSQIQQQIKAVEDRVQSSPAVEQQFKELTRGYQTALDSYNDLQKKRDEAEMYAELQRKQQGEQFRVLDPANLPDKPSFPNRPLFAAGGLGGGLALGLVISFLLEMKDSSLKTERDVEFALRLPVLAMIPEIEPAAAEDAMRKEEPVLTGVGAGTAGRSE